MLLLQSDGLRWGKAQPAWRRAIAPRRGRGSIQLFAQNFIGGLFGDHVDGGNDEIARDSGKDRGIDDPEPANAVHPELAVDHAALFLRLHGAGTAGMVAPGIVRDMALQLVVS